MTHKITKAQVCRSFAKSMREFGYPDCDEEMASEIYDAYKDGKRDNELPHGVIGMFAERQFEELEEALGTKLPLGENK